jgi:hypothetical protein
MDFNCLNVIGLSMNLVGTLFVALYIRKDSNELVEGEEGMKLGEKRHALYIRHSGWIYFGVTLILIGFILQIIATI